MSLLRRHFRAYKPFWLLLLGVLASISLAAILPVHADELDDGVPLVIGNRTVHHFRASMGAFSPAERADAARKRIDEAFLQPGDGWTSIDPGEHGIAIKLDGKTLFHVIAGDVRHPDTENVEDLANQASHILQKAWSEARESREPNINMKALGRTALATLAWLSALVILVKLASWARHAAFKRLARGMKALAPSAVTPTLLRLMPSALSRLILLMAWLLGLALSFVYLTYSLAQFVATRPAGDSLHASLTAMFRHGSGAVIEAIPGIFVSIFIFLLAWLAVRILAEVFAGIEARADDDGYINAHTAPATRRIVTVLVWLFAIAMAYPYLPGSHTEAFKGLSVILGVMVSIGGAGVIGQVASGIMIVYTGALKKGEYVRIQDREGMVTELGLFVTRLRTGYGEEIAIPNTVILGNVTRNFSRATGGPGCLLETTVTIGYDTPWRQVHALLLEAARSQPDILEAPPAQVLQTALSDFYVEYKLVAHLAAEAVPVRSRVANGLHAAIQDVFNREGVQIMSPHYCLDPDVPKLATGPQSQPTGPA